MTTPQHSDQLEARLRAATPDASSTTSRRCRGCYNSFGGWWCDNCEQWPCKCFPADGDSSDEVVPGDT